jgi:hypothetical protein
MILGTMDTVDTVDTDMAVVITTVSMTDTTAA